MKYLLLVSTSLATLGLSASVSGAATCSVAGDGVTVTCASGGSYTGFSDNSDNLEITVKNGAEVSDSSVALGGTGSNIDVVIMDTASVTSTGDHAIEFGDYTYVRNEGDLTADKDAVHAGDYSRLSNYDTVVAGSDGFDAGDGTTFLNYNNASVTAGKKGVKVGDDATVYNYNNAVIEAGTEGVETGDNAHVENYGTISADEDGVQVGAAAIIYNTGTIESTGVDGDGIDIDDGTIYNYGSIIAAGSAGIDFDAGGDSTIANATGGLIQGVYGIMVETGVDDDPNVAAQVIYNQGTITGTGGIAMLLGEGEDELRLYQGSEVFGETLFGDDEDTLRLTSNFTYDGYDDLFDGGADFDTVVFDFSSDALLGVSQSGSVLTLTFALFDIDLAAFELFAFTDVSLDAADMAAMAAVPLPTTALLLGGALAGISALRRRA